MCAVAVVALAGCSSSRARTSPGPPPSTQQTQASLPTAPMNAANTFVTTTNEPGSGYTVQVRSMDHGTVVWDPVQGHSPTTVSATHDSTGTLIVALTTGCQATIERLDPKTGHVVVVRHLRQDVGNIALSPDGSRLAYVTHPTCSVPDCNGSCAGAAMFNPNVLAVLDLTTGRSTRTATDTPGHPLFGLSWSPDGQQIVAGYNGNRDQLLIFDAANPNFATAHRVPDPGGHGYSAPAWTTSGIVAAQESGSGSLSPSRLVRVNADGKISATWSLPSCVNGIFTATNPTHKRLMVQSDIGYGNGSCSKKWTIRFATTIGTQLHTILEVPNPSAIQLNS